MSDFIRIDINGFGLRLKEERERLGLSLSDFGSLGQVNRMTQMRYETGSNFPTVEYMHRLGQHEVNTLFVETGLHTSNLVQFNDLEAFSNAIDLVDDLMKFHNFKPSAEFRSRSILKVYRQILKFGAKKAKPNLEDLLNAVQR